MKRQESKFDIYNLQFTMTRSVPATTIVTRGYTGHEHLDDFKLINMNGRLYDPVLGRFLSADPYVQDATNSQFFNRYSYCVGNPLKYVDPSGYEAQQYYHQSGLSGLTSLMNQYDKLYGRGDYGCNGPAVSALNVIWLSTIGLGSGNGAVSLLLMASESGMLLSTDQRLDGQQGQAIFSPLPSKPGQRGVYIQVSGSLTFITQNNYTVDVTSQDVHCIWVPIGGILNWIDFFNNSIGGMAEGFKNSPGSLRLTNGAYNGNSFSLHYYQTGWGGGSVANIKTYKLPAIGRNIGKGTIGLSILIGGMNVYEGIKKDGFVYGENARNATYTSSFSFAGSIVGAEYGAYMGASIGIWFFGVGAAPGAIVGGIIGGVAGGYGGTAVGEEFSKRY